jgi:hypothetical protein
MYVFETSLLNNLGMPDELWLSWHVLSHCLKFLCIRVGMRPSDTPLSPLDPFLIQRNEAHNLNPISLRSILILSHHLR